MTHFRLIPRCSEAENSLTIQLPLLWRISGSSQGAQKQRTASVYSCHYCDAFQAHPKVLRSREQPQYTVATIVTHFRLIPRCSEAENSLSIQLPLLWRISGSSQGAQKQRTASVYSCHYCDAFQAHPKVLRSREQPQYTVATIVTHFRLIPRCSEAENSLSIQLPLLWRISGSSQGAQKQRTASVYSCHYCDAFQAHPKVLRSREQPIQLPLLWRISGSSQGAQKQRTAYTVATIVTQFRLIPRCSEAENSLYSCHYCDAVQAHPKVLRSREQPIQLPLLWRSSGSSQGAQKQRTAYTVATIVTQFRLIPRCSANIYIFVVVTVLKLYGHNKFEDSNTFMHSIIIIYVHATLRHPELSHQVTLRV